MTKQTQHTAVKLPAELQSRRNIKNEVCLWNEHENLVAYPHNDTEKQVMDEIARRYNSHTELLEALEPIVDCWGLGQSPEKFCERVKDFMEHARSVIAKARSE